MTFLKKGVKWKQKRNNHNNKQITTATTSAQEEEGVVSVVWGRWGMEGLVGRTTETNMAVSFTVYSSTPETWYKAIEFCLLGLSFHSSHRRGV